MRAGRLILALALLSGCSGVEHRGNCSTTIEAHPQLPYPAGVIVVRCDGVERVRITARRVTNADH